MNIYQDTNLHKAIAVNLTITFDLGGQQKFTNSDFVYQTISDSLLIKTDGSTSDLPLSSAFEALIPVAYNLKLSQERAAAVATWLSNNTKISNERMTIQGFGESQPLANN